jgi:hypothetical protein
MTIMVTEPGPAIGDDKDWTWAAERTCPDCGYRPLTVAGPDLGAALRDSSDRWRRVLAGARVRDRPRPEVWSPLEYACHVRDVHRLFTARVGLMLAEDDPEFADWDQDGAAVAGRYWEQQPEAVADELAQAAEVTAARYDAVPPDAWGRTGRRSNGAMFTVTSIGRYHLHDVVHHLYDVRG